MLRHQSFRIRYAAVAAVRLGNSGRNALRGPGIVNLDASLFRTFSLTERINLQFPAQAMNATNTPHFNNPDNWVGSNTFGYITSALDDQRILRLALRLAF